MYILRKVSNTIFFKLVTLIENKIINTDIETYEKVQIISSQKPILVTMSNVISISVDYLMPNPSL